MENKEKEKRLMDTIPIIKIDDKLKPTFDEIIKEKFK